MTDAAANPDAPTNRLAALARKGEAATRFRSARAVRQVPFAPPPRVPRRALIGSVSQLYHGELLTARLCQGLKLGAATAEARDCLQLQHEDEIAHAGLYADYLADLGGMAPRHRVLDLLEQSLAAWNSEPVALILAVHVLLEGEAAALQRQSDAWLPCPRFAAINRLIAQDEARHIAFGRQYLPGVLPALPLRERHSIYLWLRDLWWRAVRQIYGGGGLAGFAAAPALSIWGHQRWCHWRGELRRLGLYTAGEAPEFERI